jgi:hypothetical protein
MTRLKLTACSAALLVSVAGLSFQLAGPVVMMAVGLLLTSAALGVYDPGHLALRRGARLALLGGLTVGISLVLVGLLAALTTLL